MSNEIEIYEYETKERTNFLLTNFGLLEQEFLKFEGEEIDSFSIDYITGLIVLRGKILGKENEFKLHKWNQDKNDLIKKLDYMFVRNGFARHLRLNVGIESIYEDYKQMGYIATFRQDKRCDCFIHRIVPISYEFMLDLKIDKRNISISNIKGDTINEAILSSLGFGLAMYEGMGIISAASATAAIAGTTISFSVVIPVAITLVVGGSALVSSVVDIGLEILDMEEYKGKGNFLREFLGDIGEILGGKRGEEILKSSYDTMIFLYGAVTGVISILSLTKINNYKKISKFAKSQSYIKIKFVKFRNTKTGAIIEGAERHFEKGRFIGDTLNSIDVTRTIDDEAKKRKRGEENVKK